MLSAVLYLLLEVSAGGDVVAMAAAAPKQQCEIRMPVWCIYKDDVVIKNEPGRVPGYRSVWTMWGDYWKEHPAVILEPAGCRVGLSDEIELISIDRRYVWNEEEWNSLVVRLKSDGSCDLRMLSPPKGADPVGAAFSANLSSIQACSTADCEGQKIGAVIWPQVQNAEGWR